MFDKLWIKDTSGKKSVTMTAFIVGFLVVNLKLLASGLTFMGYTMSAFSGSDYGMSLAALGSIYLLRRKIDSDNNNTTTEDKTNA